MKFKSCFSTPSSLPNSPSLPFDVKLHSSEMCWLDMAASQNLTHVKSPLAITSCVTLTDRIMFYFCTALAVVSLLHNKDQPRFQFILPLYILQDYNQAPFFCVNVPKTEFLSVSTVAWRNGKWLQRWF